MKKLKVSQVAKIVGASVATVYRKINSCETVKTHLTKEKGCLFLDEEGFEILKKSFQKDEPQTANPETEYLKKLLEQQQGMMQELIARQAEERQRTDSIIMKLAHDLEDTRRSALAIESKVNALLPKPNEIDQTILNQPPKPVAVWTPPARKDPLESAGLLEKVWAYFMEPERMRSQCIP